MATASTDGARDEQPDGHEPPRFTVDLSLPPEHRYDHIAPQMAEAIKAADVNGLLNSIIETTLPVNILGTPSIPRLLRGGILLLARIALRRVYTDEETAEIRGISRVTHIPMFQLVIFNVLLDILLGCTSGGVLFDGVDNDSDASSQHEKPRNNPGASQTRFRQTAYRRARDQAAQKSGRIAHFRTLDWSMDPLRHLIVQLDYVRSQGGPIIARTVGYFGYVGVLTGLRKGLSISLNHRATHDGSTWRKELSFRWNQAMVFLGQRPSISSTLRYILLSPDVSDPRHKDMKPHNWKAWRGFPPPQTLSTDLSQPHSEQQGELAATVLINSIITSLTSSPSTSAYLIFCTPQKVYSLEVDNRNIVSVSSSSTFLTTTNHDIAHESSESQSTPSTAPSLPTTCFMEEIISESMNRKRSAKKAYHQARRSCRTRSTTNPEFLNLEDIISILNYNSIIDPEVTHFATIMDPTSGRIPWTRVFDVPEDYETDKSLDEEEVAVDGNRED